jgi:hypothetical protein
MMTWRMKLLSETSWLAQKQGLSTRQGAYWKHLASESGNQWSLV